MYKQKDIVLQLEIKNSILWLKDKVEKILQKDEKKKTKKKIIMEKIRSIRK